MRHTNTHTHTHAHTHTHTHSHTHPHTHTLAHTLSRAAVEYRNATSRATRLPQLSTLNLFIFFFITLAPRVERYNKSMSVEYEPSRLRDFPCHPVTYTPNLFSCL